MTHFWLLCIKYLALSNEELGIGRNNWHDWFRKFDSMYNINNVLQTAKLIQ